ncbi:MAG: Urease accessory protein UreF [Acidimicrobiaceae bacterium]|nr:Urease accessory protein UreF [Acidimicrobiaceae bacterium]
MPGNDATFLLFGDARMPTGGHAHSGGVEEAAATGRVRTPAALHTFLEGRLLTTGLVDAALAAASLLASPDAPWASLDAEAAARCPSPELRAVARAQGRRLLRLGQRTWRAPPLDALAGATDGRPMWAVALGALGGAAGLEAGQIASAAANAAVTGPAWAAVRALSLDPFDVAAVLVQLAPALEEVAGAAVLAARTRPLHLLPADSAPLLDLGAEHHATWEVRLFAS